MDFRGVLVSAGRFNARRVRPVELFKTDTLLALIDRCQFSNEDARVSLTAALDDADPFAIVHLWEKSLNWRDDLGKSLLVCLKSFLQKWVQHTPRIVQCAMEAAARAETLPHWSWTPKNILGLAC
jgi:hypothetical protein